MVNTRLAFLFNKYVNNRLTKSEIMELQDLLGKSEDYPELRMLIETEFQREDDSVLPILNAEEWLDELELKVSDRIRKRRRIPRIRTASLRWMSVAAVLLAFIVIGALYWGLERKAGNQNIAQTNDIRPGGNRATLMLADGSIINLNEHKQGIVMSDKWTYSDGTSVMSDNDNKASIQSFVLSVPKKGTYQVTLPDGTRVWLNAATTLHYPSRFDNKERVVELDGEAYFEVKTQYLVAKNGKETHEKVPFIVKTKEQAVQVLGTQFNINAYNDEAVTKTTLVEGSVRITSGKKDNLLSPGQQATVHEGNIDVHKVDTEQYTAWKSNNFNFSEETLENILRQVARWYDVTVTYSDDKLKNERFEGLVSRDVNLSTLLNALEKTGNVRFETQGRQIKVLRK